MLKNITLNAEEGLIRRAREQAEKESKSLNALFREWLRRYIKQAQGGYSYIELMESLSHVHPGRKFSRTEMNEH